MKKIILCMSVMFGILPISNAQISADRFGKGITFIGKDSTYKMNVGLRFQSLFTNEWDVPNDEISALENHQSNMLIRRARLKFGGWAFSPKVSYKMELGLSNRDISGGATTPFGKTANYILDAYVSWNFYKNLSLRFGQFKVQGNRERVISSGNLQFVDRSRLNSRYTLDRDMGFMLSNHLTLGDKMIVKAHFSVMQGEGRNITVGNFDGYAYNFKIEALPFGAFQSKGDYIGSAIKKETSPKLAIGLSYEINDNAVRERGQKGRFIQDELGNYQGKTLNTLFADLMFKYQDLSLMAEYADKRTDDGDPDVLSSKVVIGTFYTGTGINLQAGYMLPKNWEIAARWTSITPDAGVALDETHYTLGVSKYIVGHKLKVQSDLSYIQDDSGDDNLIFRMQMDIHF